MVDFLVNVLGSLMFLFVFWKRLKEDYSSQLIFSSAFYILLLSYLSSFLISWFFPAWIVWAFILGAILGVTVSVMKLRLKFNELVDSSVISLLPLQSFIFLEDSVNNSSLASFIAFVTTLFFIFIFYILNENYRKFSWYKSGKLGFAGFVTLGLLFLTRSGVAIFFGDVLSFVGKSEAFLSGTLALISFIGLVYIAKQK